MKLDTIFYIHEEPVPVWTLTAPFSGVEQAFRAGDLTWEQWTAYKAIWFYSAPRFSDVVPWPPVRAINAYLDAQEAGIISDTIELVDEAVTYRWSVTFGD